MPWIIERQHPHVAVVTMNTNRSTHKIRPSSPISMQHSVIRAPLAQGDRRLV
jgi:hypothetical protein